MNLARAIAAAMSLQVRLTRRSPGQLVTLMTAPLFSAIFLSVALHAGRSDLVVHAVIAPGLTSLWFVAVQVGASVVGEERWNARLELLMSTPTPLSVVIMGRVTVIVCVGTLAFAESWLVASIFFGVSLPLPHPAVFGLTVVATCLATATTATALSAAFVLSRSFTIFQNSLTYPFFVLGGVLVPLSALPGWIGVLGKGVFLSWAADLLRDAYRTPEVDGVAARLSAVLLLGAAALVVAVLLVDLVVRRTRRTASAGYA